MKIWKLRKFEPGAESHPSVHQDEKKAMAELSETLRVLVDRLKAAAFREASKVDGDDMFVYEANRAIEEMEISLAQERPLAAFDHWRAFLKQSEETIGRTLDIGDVWISWRES